MYLSRFLHQDELEPLEKKISYEKSCTIWMIKLVTSSNIALESEHQTQTSDKCRAHLPLFPATGTLNNLFWNYFQLTCILWNQILADKQKPNDSLVRKLGHVLQDTIVMFEQSPQNVQYFIIKHISLRLDVLSLCGRIAVVVAGAKGIVQEI